MDTISGLRQTERNPVRATLARKAFHGKDPSPCKGTSEIRPPRKVAAWRDRCPGGRSEARMRPLPPGVGNLRDLGPPLLHMTNQAIEFEVTDYSVTSSR